MIAKLYSAFRRKTTRPTPFTLPTAEFLRSEAYQRLMSEKLPLDGSYDLNEAQNETRNYLWRHRDQAHRLGVFRWRGMQENMEEVLQRIAAASHPVDFGGAACPLGFGATVVDLLERDGTGQKVSYHSLEELPFEPDFIFSSHTLEHMPELEEALAQIQRTLSPAGTLVLHLPAYTCTRWWPGVHRNDRYKDHAWSFGLAGSDPMGAPCYREIDKELERFFTIERASYCGDNSIFILASKAG